MQKIFQKKDMNLIVSGVEDEVAFNYDFITGENLDVEYKRITLDENMLYCINQNIAALHSTIDSVAFNYNQNKITAWDLIQGLCSAFKFSLVIGVNNQYSLVLGESFYVVNDDNKLSYKSEDIEAKYEDVSISYYGLERRFYKTAAADPVELKQFDGYGSANAIQWYNNFELYFHYRYGGAWFPGGQVPLEFKVGDELSPPLTTLNVIQAKVDKLLNDYVSEEIITEIETTKKSVIKNSINFAKRVSKIKQEI